MNEAYVLGFHGVASDTLEAITKFPRMCMTCISDSQIATAVHVSGSAQKYYELLGHDSHRTDTLTLADVELACRDDCNHVMPLNSNVFWMRGYRPGDTTSLFGINGGCAPSSRAVGVAGDEGGFMLGLDVTQAYGCDSGEVRCGGGGCMFVLRCADVYTNIVSCFGDSDTTGPTFTNTD